MRRAAALIAAVFLCAMQSGDAVRVRAGICEDARCRTLTNVHLEPVRVYVFVIVPMHPENRWLDYGLVCNGEAVKQTGPIDLKAHPAPSYTTEYANVRAGECWAVAIVERADGSQQKARSERLTVNRRG